MTDFRHGGHGEGSGVGPGSEQKSQQYQYAWAEFIEAQPYETVKDRVMGLGQGLGLKAAAGAAQVRNAASASAKMKPTARLVRALAHELCVPSRRDPIGRSPLRSLPFQI